MHEYRLGKLEVAVVTKPSTVRYHTFQFLRVNVLESYTTQCWVVYTNADPPKRRGRKSDALYPSCRSTMWYHLHWMIFSLLFFEWPINSRWQHSHSILVCFFFRAFAFPVSQIGHSKTTSNVPPIATSLAPSYSVPLCREVQSFRACEPARWSRSKLADTQFFS
jgi:hypothetical protein